MAPSKIYPVLMTSDLFIRVHPSLFIYVVIVANQTEAGSWNSQNPFGLNGNHVVSNVDVHKEQD